MNSFSALRRHFGFRGCSPFLVQCIQTHVQCALHHHIYIYRYRCDYFSPYSIRFFYILIFFHSISFVFPHVFPPFPATSSHALVSSPIGTQQNLRVLACDKNANSCRVINKKPYNIHSYFAYKKLECVSSRCEKQNKKTHF